MAIDIVKQLGNRLLLIDNPSRYIGKEFTLGPIHPFSEDTVNMGICFPDLYEIGMSNNAMRILYDELLSMGEHVACDRVFSVAPDFEQLLRKEGIPLFTLEQGFELHKLDVLGFSVGYELAATNILQVLELGNIPLRAKDRTADHPIVIGGGPAITNPLPLAPFFDYFYIGEAESFLAQVVTLIHEAKLQQHSRDELHKKLKELPYLWYEGKQRATRTLDDDFATPTRNGFTHYVVPHFKVAQDNGVVEIMRGCPNGCRFCHAGQFYKPYRQKEYETIEKQVAQYVDEIGYREITLSSLSSGDHPQLKHTIEQLNTAYAKRHISFALPSLKVSSFTLDILQELSQVRKSGLTFAIETPLTLWQQAMNKEVPLEQVITIIKEAKGRGWKLAKFYFMVGLPFIDKEEEGPAIVSFLKEIALQTGIQMNINIGTFIPKAHTPFQWAAQMRQEDSFAHLSSIKKAIQQEIRGARVSYHDPFISYLEGILSRGDSTVASLIEHAYRLGCRLDAWDEHINKEAWQTAIASMPTDVEQKIFTERSTDEALGWDSVSLGVSTAYLKREWTLAKESLLTKRCLPNCSWPCGVCGTKHHVAEAATPANQPTKEKSEPPKPPSYPVLFCYEKKGRGIFISHINVMRLFEQAFQRSGIDVAFTQGFNPKPKMEFVNPLTTGASGLAELVLVDIHMDSPLDQEKTLQALNAAVSDGFVFTQMRVINTERRTTVSKHMGGSVYQISDVTNDALITILDEASKAHHSDTMLTKTAQGTYTLISKGEKNPIKALFGSHYDKFQLLAELRLQRIMIYTGDYRQNQALFNHPLI